MGWFLEGLGAGGCPPWAGPSAPGWLGGPMPPSPLPRPPQSSAWADPFEASQVEVVGAHVSPVTLALENKDAEERKEVANNWFEAAESFSNSNVGEP